MYSTSPLNVNPPRFSPGHPDFPRVSPISPGFPRFPPGLPDFPRVPPSFPDFPRVSPSLPRFSPSFPRVSPISPEFPRVSRFRLMKKIGVIVPASNAVFLKVHIKNSYLTKFQYFSKIQKTLFSYSNACDLGGENGRSRSIATLDV